MSTDTNIVKWQGRSTKLTKKLTDAMNLVADDPSTIALTDEELVLLINEHLKPAEKISYHTFRDWKNKNYIPKSVEVEQLQAFSSALKRIRLHQKSKHIKAMIENENAGTWQRRAWLLERKFDDLNLTRKVETEVTHKGADIEILPPNNMNIEEAEYKEIKD